MNNIHRRKVLGSAIGLLAATTANLSWAQNEAWPTKPIQLILGFPPGGPNDLVARALALRLSEQLKQQVVVENRAGANGNIAAAAVARAAPDGQTFLYNSSALALSSVLYTKNQIDPRKDLLPVNGTAALPLVLIVEASFPASNFREWAAQVRANPGKFNYGSPGAGNLAHVAVAMILQANGLDAVHAPYKGSSEALQGLIGGSTQFQLDSINSPLALIKSGRIKPLFVTSSQRSPVLPEVQTLVEGGSSPIDAAAWQGVMAPAKTPLNIVQRMATEITKAMSTPEMKSALAAQGAYSIATTPERYNTFFLEEIDRYRKTVDALGLKLD
jgi:tripartite-type tricarboxylate transporter receptor subunit TctC